MPKPDRLQYQRLIKSLIADVGFEAAMRLAPGGEFELFGLLERELLIQHGLHRDAYLIDVGCGSGRLARPLTDHLSDSARYLGLDIVTELVKYARRLVGRPNWRFKVTDGQKIPEKDGQADMVCFFSVLTHLTHEQSYLYLAEARRVLKPGGKIVLTFLEFDQEIHWPIFEAAVQKLDDPSYTTTTFIGRDGIRAWAAHLNLRIEALVSADECHIAFDRVVTLEDGRLLGDNQAFGQSICVMVKD